MGMTQTATRLIKRFGQTATLTKPGEVSGPPYAPEYGPPTDHSVTVAVTEYDWRERDTTAIQESDLRVFMTAGIEPTTADKLTVGGVEYGIFHVGILGPDGTVICYALQVRA